ncbi:MAG: PAS domain-containing protein, partial [Archaeoglobaceae archaeon]
MEFGGDVNFWKSIVDRMLAGVIITDITMKYLYVNDVFSAVTGYGKEELKEMKITDLAHPSHLQQASEAIEKVMTGKSIRGEFMYLTKRGEKRCAFGFFTPYVYKGKVYAVGNFIDITYAKELEEKLKKSEEFYRSLIDNSSSPILIVQDGKFVFVNRILEEITGYTREELIGRNAFDLVYPEDVEVVLRRYRERVAGLRDVDS